MWTIPPNDPAIVIHHVFIPSSLIPDFHDLQILVESFTLLITDSTKIFWKRINVAEQEMNFESHVATQIAEAIKAILNDVLVIFIFEVS